MVYDDLRKGRYSEISRLYFVTTVLKNRNEAIFKDLFCARKVIAEMRFLHDTEQVSSISCVIMPDHLHWLFQLQESTLGQVMKGLKTRSAHRLNHYLNRKTRSGKKPIMTVL